MRVLVTGADSFVGKHLCRAFRRAGDEIFEIRGPSEVAPASGIWSLDLADGAALSRVMDACRPEGVVHLAGASSVAESHRAAAKTFATNTLGTVNVLDAVRSKAPQARALIIGSGEVYGPIPEGERASETMPTAPTSPYAASKAAAELAAFQYFRSYGVAALSARSFNHLGAGQSPHFVVPSFARQLAQLRTKGSLAVGNLEPVRDFSHVEDVVDAYRVLLVRGTPGEAYNVCSGVGRSIRSLLDELIELSGAEVTTEIDRARFRPVDLPYLVGDPSKLHGLGWKPTRTVTEALRDALAEARRYDTGLSQPLAVAARARPAR